MSEKFTSITQDISRSLGVMRKDIPDAMQGFSALSKAALAPGVMSALDKELIALAIGVSSRCDACIGFHIKALIRLGVSRSQLMETLAVCTYMGGGPALMYAAEAVRAYEEFYAAAPVNAATA
jgi:AhpD family alkylhydroperoxidase